MMKKERRKSLTTATITNLKVTMQNYPRSTSVTSPPELEVVWLFLMKLALKFSYLLLDELDQLSY